MLAEKVKLLAQLMRMSRKTVLYTGAGISVSAGIGQAARGGAAKGRNWSAAEPTLTHRAAGAPIA